jgi:hypothetical protein
VQQLTGLLIEYLATGSASLLWVLLLIVVYASLPSDKDHPAVIALLLPLTYVLGMISDFLGEWIVRNRKRTIKVNTRQGTAVEKLESQEIHTRIVTYSPELAKELNARSSRDRIARGVLVNVPFVGMATILYFVKNLRHTCYLCPAAGLTIIFTILLTLVIYRMWARFQEHSYKYEVFAYQVVEEKLKAAARPPSAPDQHVRN